MAVMIIKKQNGKKETVETRPTSGYKPVWDEFRLPRTSPEAMSAALSRAVLPAGAPKAKKVSKGRLWRPGAQARSTAARTSSKGASFSMNLRNCEGELGAVLILGLQLMKSEMDAGNRERAQHIAERLKGLEKEYARRAFERRIIRVLDRVRREAG